ncbi:Nn.00g023650.m01.CDS01 [Neocucurbitaria sp. VM-36]
MRSFLSAVTLLSLPFFAICQSGSDGYSGYKLDIRDDGDPLAVLYETENTPSNVSAFVPEPDVMLNASVHVGEIFIGVDNLTAKINLDAQVLQLLQFNAGVDLSIDKVTLLIQNVTAKVYLEARLGNLVKMIGDVLDSIDLNPVIAELGNGLGTIINDTAGLIGNIGDGLNNDTAQAKAKRDLDLHQWDLHNNILYSVNNFEGNTHKRRVLSQNGDIVEQTLNNNGLISGSTVVGDYLKSMRFNGFNESVTFHGQEVWEEEYVYEPFAGLYSISGIFKNKSTGQVVGTQLLAEARGGGSASIGNEKA